MFSLFCDSVILPAKWMYYSYDHFVLKWKLVTTYKAFRMVPGAYLVCVILLVTLITLINIVCVRILTRYEQMQGHLKQNRVKTILCGGETSDLSVINQTLAQFFPWLFGGMLSQAGQEANLSPHLKSETFGPKTFAKSP